jgi:hypothetical protein
MTILNSNLTSSTLLFPPFLKEMDRHFLLNQPRLWSTRIYYLGYWSLLLDLPIWLLSAGFAVLAPFQSWIPRFESFTRLFWSLIAVMVAAEILCALYWFFRLRQYYPEREYAPFSLREEYTYLVIYLLCLVLLLAPAFLITVPIRWQVSHLAREMNVDQDLAYIAYLSDNLAKTVPADTGSLESLPAEKPVIDFAVIRKYTANAFDENKTPFDWAGFVPALANARSNASTLQDFAFGNQRWILAAMLGFLNTGLFAFLFHYFVAISPDDPRTDRESEEFGEIFSTLGPTFVVLSVILAPSLRYLLDHMSWYVYLLVMAAWAGTIASSYLFFSFLPASGVNERGAPVAAAVMFLLSIFYSTALTLIVINPNPNLVGLYGLLATLAYVPFIPYLKRSLLPVFALPK